MIDQYPPANGVLTSLIWRKTMSGGETSLSGYDNASQALSYTPGQEQVYLNGILLVRGDDYTATNGTSITGLAALTAGDFVQINAYNNFSVATLPASSITGTITSGQVDSSILKTSGGQAISYFGSSDAFKITNTGTGNSFVVEDSTNPDASPFTIDSNGLVWVGSTTDLPNIPELNMILSTETGAGHSLVVRKSVDGTNGSNLTLARSRGTNSTPTALQNNDGIGGYIFHGFDGTNYLQVASISASVDGTPGTGDMPTRLVFSTTADGGSSPTERMRIDSTGRIQIPAGGILEAPLSTRVVSGTSDTLVLADAGKLIESSNSAATTFTVPLNSSVAYPVGTQITLLQTGTGQLTIAGTGGVTVNATPGLKLRAQWSSATLIKRATDTWVLIGDLTA